MPYLDADDLADLAEYYWDIREEDKAEEALKQNVRLHPDDIRVISQQIKIALYKEDDIDKAKKLLKQISPYEQEYDAAYIRAEVALADSQPESANKVLAQRLAIITDDKERENFLLDAADLFEMYDYYDLSLQWLLKGKDLLKNSEEAKEMMARTLVKNGEYEKGKRLFNELIDNDPYNSDYWYSLSMAQMWNGEIEDSIKSAEYAIAIDPEDDESMKLKADALYEFGNYEEALKYYRKCQELAPENGGYDLMAATMLSLLNKPEEGLKELQKAEQKAGYNERLLAKVYPELAMTYLKIGKKDKAEEYLNYFKNLREAQTPTGKVNVGHILLGLDRVPEAASFFIEAIQDGNEDIDLQMQVVASLMDNNYYQMAYEFLKDLLEGENGDKTVKKGYAALAICCDELGKKDEFLKCIKISAETQPAETRSVLSEYFPEGMDPKDYYEYMYKKIKTDKA